MTFEFRILFDLAGSLAILGMLAVAYGTIRRSLPDSGTAGSLLGVLFGLVAIVQMKTPFQPFDGLLVDMRNVPIVLAGAFLGMRGFLICVVMAAAARLHIGGVGVSAGIAGMILSGGMGGLWNAMTQDRPRGARSLMVLAVMGSAHLAAFVLLPPNLAAWFLSNAAPILLGLNVLAIPLVGSLLERERGLLASFDGASEEAPPGGDGPLPIAALGWAMAHSAVVGGLRGPVACVAIRLRHRGLVARLWGSEVDRAALEVLGSRLAGVIPDGGVVGWVGRGMLLMSVPALPGDAVSALCAGIRRTVSDEPISVTGAGCVRLSVDLDIRRYDVLPPLADVLTDMDAGKRSGRASRARPGRDGPDLPADLRGRLAARPLRHLRPAAAGKAVRPVARDASRDAPGMAALMAGGRLARLGVAVALRWCIRRAASERPGGRTDSSGRRHRFRDPVRRRSRTVAAHMSRAGAVPGGRPGFHHSGTGMLHRRGAGGISAGERTGLCR